MHNSQRNVVCFIHREDFLPSQIFVKTWGSVLERISLRAKSNVRAKETFQDLSLNKILHTQNLSRDEVH